MKTYPDMKIDAFVSVCGLINNTNPPDPDPSIAPILQDLVDPREIYSKVVNALDTIFKFTSFKPFSDQVQTLFLGIAVKAPLQYRNMTATPFSLADFYSALTIPILHFIGKEDKAVPFAHSLFMDSLNPNSKSIIYEEVGHSPLWENIKEFNKDLVKFVGGI